MKILITGTSQGIGKAIAELFLKKNHEVVGFDRQESGIIDAHYTHYCLDIRDYENLPNIKDVQILINNAGTQNEDDIDINLKAVINITAGVVAASNCCCGSSLPQNAVNQ